MIIPGLIDKRFKLVDKDGYATEEFFRILSLLWTELQTKVSEKGFVIPNQPTTTINNINLPNSLIIDQDLNVAKLHLNGVYKTITTS